MYSTNDHLWRLKFAECCFQELKRPCCWGRRRKRKSQEAQRDNNILFNNLRVFDMFVFLSAITMLYLYDSVYMPWKFGFPLRKKKSLYLTMMIYSRPEVFLVKGVLRICSKFTGEPPCRSVISIKLIYNFIEITFRHGCSPVNLLHIFRTPLTKKNTSG